MTVSFKAYTALEMMMALTGLPAELCGDTYYDADDIASWWYRLLVELGP